MAWALRLWPRRNGSFKHTFAHLHDKRHARDAAAACDSGGRHAAVVCNDDALHPQALAFGALLRQPKVEAVTCVRCSVGC